MHPMSTQLGWTLIYQAKNSWNFRSKSFSSENEAAKHALSQIDRGVFQTVKIVGSSGQMADVTPSMRRRGVLFDLFSRA